MIELAAALEGTALAQFLKASRWVYPAVNAGHILGIALLVGAVVPMDVRLVGLVRRPDIASTVALLRPFAATGFALAAACGALLFATQATDYVVNGWFQAKLAVVGLAAANAALHPHVADAKPARQHATGAASLALWPTALILGRMIGYS